MSDVTRYTVTNATGWMQPWPTSLPATMVRASDYDALAKRLKEAERCIKAANDALHGYGVEDQGQAWDKACRLLDEYQRATDSADECLGCSSPTSCAKNGCAIKRQRATDSAPAAPRAFYVGGGKTEPADPEIIGWCSGCRDAVYRGREHQCSISSLDSEVKP